MTAVCYYHGTYAFQSESTLYSWLNVKKLLARSRREIWSLSDCNWARTHNHLIHNRNDNLKSNLNGWVFDYELSGCRFESSCSQVYVTLCHFDFNYIQFVYQFLVDVTGFHYAFSDTAQRSRRKRINSLLVPRVSNIKT